MKLVPPDTEAGEEFPYVEWACNLKPRLCPYCHCAECITPPDPRPYLPGNEPVAPIP